MTESQGTPDGLSFEEALAQVAEIVRQLENGELGLEEAVELYRTCAARFVSTVEGRIDGS